MEKLLILFLIEVGGVDLRETGSKCDRDFDLSNGVFESCHPYQANDHYKKSAIIPPCVEEQQYILISGSIEHSTSCNADRLTLTYLPASNEEYVTTNFCGEFSSFILVNQSSRIDLEFKSDDVVQLGGFTIEISCLVVLARQRLDAVPLPEDFTESMVNESMDRFLAVTETVDVIDEENAETVNRKIESNNADKTDTTDKTIKTDKGRLNDNSTDVVSEDKRRVTDSNEEPQGSPEKSQLGSSTVRPEALSFLTLATLLVVLRF